MPTVPPVWTRSTVSAAPVHLVEQEPDAKSVNTSLFKLRSLNYSLNPEVHVVNVGTLANTDFYLHSSINLVTCYCRCPATEAQHVSLCLCVVVGIGKTCHYAGLQFPHSSRWEEECNSCHCTDGKVACTKVKQFFLKQC